MTTTPDSDVRAALRRATDEVTGLGLDPDAVLTQGRRVVRRRRLATVGTALAAAAVVVGVAVQLGTAQPRALPALPPTAPVGSPAVPAGALSGTTDGDGFREGRNVEVSVTPRGDGTAEEVWRLYAGKVVLRTVTRTVPAVGAGQASFLLPDASGQKGMVYGYVLSGPDNPRVGHAMAQPVVAPDALSSPSQGMGGVLTSTTTKAAVGSVFTLATAHPERVVGVTWNRSTVSGSDVVSLGDGAALRPDRRGDVDAAVVVVSRRTSLLLWRKGDLIGEGGLGFQTDAGSGALQVAVRPRSTVEKGGENDLAVGWVTQAPVTLTSSDPADSFTVAYGRPVGGRTPFVARSGRPDVKGTVTVTGGGVQQTLAVWDPQ